MKRKGVFLVSAGQAENFKVFDHAVDVEEALDVTGHGLYNYLILLSSCTIHLGAVVDMLGFSLVVPAASCDLQLGLRERGALTSVSFAGFMFAVPWGYFADTCGRRKALLISASFGFIFATLCSLSTSFTALLILKFLSSCFSTASLTLTATYIGECTPKHLRTKFIFIQNVFCLAADFVCYVLAYIVLPMEFRVAIPSLLTFRPWRLLVILMALPLGIGALMMAFLQESPKFLANIGDTDKAVKIKSIISTKTEDDQTLFCKSIVKQTVPIFKTPLVWRTLQLFYILSICCMTNNVFFIWFPTLFNSFYNSRSDVRETKSFCQKIVAYISSSGGNEMETCNDNTPINTIFSGIFFTLFFTVLNLVIIQLSSWRKRLLIVTLIISGTSAAIINLIQGTVASIVLFTMIQFTGICIATISSYFVDMYPTSCRGLASSFGMMVARFSCLGGVNLIGAIVVDYCEVTFYSWAVFTFSGVLAAMLLPSDQQASQTKR